MKHNLAKLANLTFKPKERSYHMGALLMCGGGGIRTLGSLAATPVFETGPINHSGTPPNGRHYTRNPPPVKACFE
jgi:hypothetical protein